MPPDGRVHPHRSSSKSPETRRRHCKATPRTALEALQRALVGSVPLAWPAIVSPGANISESHRTIGLSPEPPEQGGSFEFIQRGGLLMNSISRNDCSNITLELIEARAPIKRKEAHSHFYSEMVGSYLA